MRSWMIGVVLGILPTGLLPTLPGWWGLAPIALAAPVMLYWRTPTCQLGAGMCIGFLLAVHHSHGLLQRRLADDCSGERQLITGLVASLPWRGVMPDGTPRQRFELQLESGLPGTCGRPRTILLSYYGPRQIVPGQRWRFRARLKKPWGQANPGSFNIQAWFALAGIDAVGSVGAGGGYLLNTPVSPAGQVDRLRLSITRRIESLAIDDGARGILRAVTVADRSGIDPALWGLFQDFGINHLLVISGLHVGMLAGAGLMLGGLLARLSLLAGRPMLWLPGTLALLLALGYAAMAGFTVATQRALCMLACFILARLLGRNSRSSNNLLLAALVVLLLNPLAPLGSGFWLSFSAVAALLWVGHWRRRGGTLRQLAGAHLFMSLVMLPLGGWWFGGSSLVAAPVNLVMVPLVGVALVPAALLAALLFLLGLPGDEQLWQAVAWPVEHLLSLARAQVESAGPTLYMHHNPGPAAALMALVSVALLAVPGGCALRGLSLLLMSPLLVGLAAPAADETAPPRVTVLDVGQGTAVVFQAGERVLLYDTGGGDPAGLNMATAVVLPFLRARGITGLDTLVISHADRDHSAGTAAILRDMPVGRIRYGGGIPGLDRGLPCRGGEAWRWPGGVSFQILSPAEENSLSSNDNSCVLHIAFDAKRLLLPGDIGNRRERELVRYWRERLHSQWLLAGHHGSRSSSSHAWLKHVRAGTVVISSGHANRFGHPDPRVVERFAEDGATLHETSREGALEFTFAPGKPPVFSAWRREKRRFWM